MRENKKSVTHIMPRLNLPDKRLNIPVWHYPIKCLNRYCTFVEIEIPHMPHIPGAGGDSFERPNKQFNVSVLLAK